MRYYIIAGEASGDLHASGLMREIRALDPEAVFRCWGGDRMMAEGAELVTHIREMSFMGWVEVVANLRLILRNFTQCKQDITSWKPDVLILVDYPGFNLPMARFAKKNGIRTIYYISPQVWAWNRSRVHKIRRSVDLMLVILPFEHDFFRQHGVRVQFVGHPLMDALDQFREKDAGADAFRRKNALPDKPLVAILPGSRKQEVRRSLDIMMAAARHFPTHHFVVAGVTSLPTEVYGKLPDSANFSVVYGQTHTLLLHARAALVNSGTATLEAALLDVPQVVCYRMGFANYIVASVLVKAKYISLVNLVLDRPAVRELVEWQFTGKNLVHEMRLLLEDDAYRDTMQSYYQDLRLKLGSSGANRRAARQVVSFLRQA